MKMELSFWDYGGSICVCHRECASAMSCVLAITCPAIPISIFGKEGVLSRRVEGDCVDASLLTLVAAAMRYFAIESLRFASLVRDSP